MRSYFVLEIAVNSGGARHKIGPIPVRKSALLLLGIGSYFVLEIAVNSGESDTNYPKPYRLLSGGYLR